MASATYTAYIQYPVFSPDWRFTVDTLANLYNVALAEFVSERVAYMNIYLFEVFGDSRDVEAFQRSLEKEDRKLKYIRYRDFVELS